MLRVVLILRTPGIPIRRFTQEKKKYSFPLAEVPTVDALLSHERKRFLNILNRKKKYGKVQKLDFAIKFEQDKPEPLSPGSPPKLQSTSRNPKPVDSKRPKRKPKEKRPSEKPTQVATAAPNPFSLDGLIPAQDDEHIVNLTRRFLDQLKPMTNALQAPHIAAITAKRGALLKDPPPLFVLPSRQWAIQFAKLLIKERDRAKSSRVRVTWVDRDQKPLAAFKSLENSVTFFPRIHSRHTNNLIAMLRELKRKDGKVIALGEEAELAIATLLELLSSPPVFLSAPLKSPLPRDVLAALNALAPAPSLAAQTAMARVGSTVLWVKGVQKKLPQLKGVPITPTFFVLMRPVIERIGEHLRSKKKVRVLKLEGGLRAEGEPCESSLILASREDATVTSITEEERVETPPPLLSPISICLFARDKLNLPYNHARRRLKRLYELGAITDPNATGFGIPQAWRAHYEETIRFLFAYFGLPPPPPIPDHYISPTLSSSIIPVFPPPDSFVTEVELMRQPKLLQFYWSIVWNTMQALFGAPCTLLLSHVKLTHKEQPYTLTLAQVLTQGWRKLTIPALPQVLPAQSHSRALALGDALRVTSVNYRSEVPLLTLTEWLHKARAQMASEGLVLSGIDELAQKQLIRFYPTLTPTNSVLRVYASARRIDLAGARLQEEHELATLRETRSLSAFFASLTGLIQTVLRPFSLVYYERLWRDKQKPLTTCPECGEHTLISTAYSYTCANPPCAFEIEKVVEGNTNLSEADVLTLLREGEVFIEPHYVVRLTKDEVSGQVRVTMSAHGVVLKTRTELKQIEYERRIRDRELKRVLKREKRMLKMQLARAQNQQNNEQQNQEQNQEHNQERNEQQNQERNEQQNQEQNEQQNQEHKEQNTQEQSQQHN